MGYIGETDFFLPQLTESIESINKERPTFVIDIFVLQQLP
jgi:hypothetical protein